jgi:hypothetical protein
MHAEPSLAANPRDPRNLLAACMVWQAGQRGLATYVSFDAGSTWHGNGLLPGIRPAYDGNVTVAFDRQGTRYLSGWAGSRAHPQRGRVCLWRTVDGGRSFTAPVTIATGLIDHPSLAADRQARGGPATLYVAGGHFGHGGLVFTRSTDRGNTFEPLRFPGPGSGSRGGRAPKITAGPAGVTAIAYYVELPNATQRIGVVTSADHGQTLAPPVFVTHVIPPPIIGGINRATGGPPITASADGEALHLERAAHSRAQHHHRLLPATARDRPRRADRAVRVRPARRHRTGQRVAVMSQPDSTRFGPPVTVTTPPFNPLTGTQQGWIGDY